MTLGRAVLTQDAPQPSNDIELPDARAGDEDAVQSARDLNASEAVEKSFAEDELLADWLPPRPAAKCDPEVQVSLTLYYL